MRNNDIKEQKPLLEDDPLEVYPATGFSFSRRWPKVSKRKICWLVLLLLLGAGIIGVLVYILWATITANCIGSERVYDTATVVTDASYCSTIGTNVLKNNGSAIDAAITTSLCLGVANAHSAGIGGGFFMTYYNRKEKKSYTLDAREVAPLAANESMFVANPQLAITGGLAIAVPGEIAGYWAAHQRFGKLPWSELFVPIIKLCKEGIPITPGLYLAAESEFEFIKSSKPLRDMFINPANGKLYNVGEKIKRPVLARVLEKIAKEGASTFYNGSLSEDIIADLNDHGSIITEKDLNMYQPIWRVPMTMTLSDDKTTHSLPPPSSGSIVAFILGVLDGYRFVPDFLDGSVEKAVIFYHRLIESMKFGYAARSLLGDPAYVNQTKEVEKLSSEEYMGYIRSLITDGMTHVPSYYGNATSKQGQFGTSHFSLVAPDGDAVAITTTINFYFGSKVVGNRTNIIFNNEMDDFSTPNTSNGYGFMPSMSNFIQPGKRPMSSMSPTIVTNGDGDVTHTCGASGGSKIISATAYTLMHMFWFGDSLKESVDKPRLHHQWLPNEVVYESNFADINVNRLEEIGHVMRQNIGRGGVVQATYTDRNGKIHAYADTRKGGCPDGF